MTLPSSTEPARQAVLYALTHVTPFARSLRAGRLFKESWPAEITAKPDVVKSSPRCFVVAKDDAAGEESFFLASGVWRAEVTFQITLWYYAGSELVKVEVARALRRIAEDKLAVAACLTLGPALALDPEGNATGLDGDALRLDGYRCSGPNPMPVRETDEPRLLKVDLLFRSTLELLTPA